VFTIIPTIFIVFAMEQKELESRMDIIYGKIKEKLTKGLQPESLKIIDESHKHKGHAGWREGGETHFALTIVSEKFAGMPRLVRHRLVLEILQEERATGVHAFSISARAPGEK